MVAEDTLKEALPGVHIDIAANGQEALQRLEKTMYDIVLMDIQMPVMDGIEATKKIRSTLPEPMRSVKIIAMTANVLQEDVKHYFEIGMNAYVSKPFKTEELLQKMASVVTPQKTTPDMSQPEEKTEAIPALPEQVTDLQFLTQFTSGNTEKVQKYIGMFLENAPKLLQTVEQTLAAKDFPALKIAAHSLKPQLSYMGVKEEVSHIFLIEQTASEAVHYERLLPLVNNLKNVCNKAFEELIAVRSGQ
jgi:CheY-like chemotaxis protein/HPt (histidine-containing phosphotransfer) domain-containing protein